MKSSEMPKNELNHLNQELDKKNELFEYIQEANELGIWELDIASDKITWTDMVYKIHEVPKDFNPNKAKAIEFYHPDYRPIVLEAITKCSVDGKSYDLVCQLITAKERLIWVRATGKKVGDKLIGSFQDITNIKKSEIRFKSVIEGTNVGTWEWNVQTGETVFNERWAEIVGYTLEELAPVSIETWMKLAHPEDLKESERRLNACFEKETEYYKFETRMKHKDGHWVWVYDSGKVFEWTHDGKPLMMYGTHKDITERKLREEKLRISEEAFRGNFENAAIGMALMDENGKWLKANAKVCEMVGYTQEELFELTFQDMTHPDDLDTDLGLLKELVVGKRDHYQMEKRYFHKDGHIVHILLAVSVVKNKQGNVLYFISQIIDISNEKESQRKLQEAISSLQAILDASKQVSIIATDKEGTVTLFNSGAEKQLGYKTQEVIGKPHPELIHLTEEVERESEELSKKYNKEIKGFETFVYETKIGVSNTKEWTYIRKDGTSFPVLLSVNTIKDHDEIVGYLGVGTDISDLKKVEKEIKSLLDITNEQNERLRNFAHIVSHNLRSHSSGISGIIQLFQMEFPEVSKHELISHLRNGVENLTQTVNDLNEIVKVNLSQSDTAQIGIYEVLQKNIDSLSMQIQQTDIEIINTVEKDLSVKAIPAYLDSIFLNMITNAIKYRSEERASYLKIQANMEKSMVSVSFEDNGQGIDLKKHGDKLFGLYKTFHDHDESRGVGLFITKNQIESMGGKIAVVSEVNVGTVFKITLPK
ncbi:PAS domain S-box protein [Psychroflexus sp. CAK1W]|uniref:PAS domain-containing protein n=1 Tax=Psychroflexus curvus TaxID=2873595 RepID=UPI001CCBF2F1|nr:PAS domain S-box protein [Psychroflexus curvus]MBZ9627852.1 PAS domain S-box protein [Psychroflexus curvus]